MYRLILQIFLVFLMRWGRILLDFCEAHTHTLYLDAKKYIDGENGIDGIALKHESKTQTNINSKAARWQQANQHEWPVGKTSENTYDFFVFCSFLISGKQENNANKRSNNARGQTHVKENEGEHTRSLHRVQSTKGCKQARRNKAKWWLNGRWRDGYYSIKYPEYRWLYRLSLALSTQRLSHRRERDIAAEIYKTALQQIMQTATKWKKEYLQLFTNAR